MFKVGDIVKRADGLEQDTLYVPNDDRARGEVLDVNYTYGLDKWVLVRWNMRPYGCVDERAEMWILEQEIELADMDLEPEEGYLYKIRFKTVEEMLQVKGADGSRYDPVVFKTGMHFNDSMIPLCGLEDYVVSEERDCNGNLVLRLLGDNPVVRRVLGSSLMHWIITSDMVKKV